MLETYILMNMALAMPENEDHRLLKEKILRAFTPKKLRKASDANRDDDSPPALLETQANESAGIFGLLGNLDMDADQQSADLVLQSMEAVLMNASVSMKAKAKTVAAKVVPDQVLADMVDSAQSLHEVFLSKSDWNVTDRTENTKYLLSSGEATDAVAKFLSSFMQLGNSMYGADGRLDKDVAEFRDVMVQDGSMDVFQEKISELKTTFGEGTMSEEDLLQKAKPFILDYLDKFKPLFKARDEMVAESKAH